VTPHPTFSWPRDYGSHPAFRTEWWYITGWLNTPDGEPLGFQITFFRTKPTLADANPSSFSPKEILIAHCALSDPKHGRLYQDQRIRRVGLSLVESSERDTEVKLERWSLVHEASSYTAHIDAEDFTYDFKLETTQPLLLNGESGYSRKGPMPLAASYYYSEPHLGVSGTLTRAAKPVKVRGEAWLDHEWSSEYLDPAAQGWDWIGLNLADGGALMAFRIRDAQGAAHWAGGTLRSADGKVQVFSPEQLSFEPLRRWISPRTGIAYPVAWRVAVAARTFELTPLMDDQENDTRLSTGAIYWEGAVRVREQGREAGRGYLELTGYGERLKLR
jgi:predicted secreted hydrolase